MKQTIGMTVAKSKLAELVGQVKYGNHIFILQRRGRPMAVLIGVDEYERLQAAAHPQADSSSPLPPKLLNRQRTLVARAQHLRERLGPPEERLAELFADLPPEDDDFWLEVQEAI
jgi:prevent-host-death family protein